MPRVFDRTSVEMRESIRRRNIAMGNKRRRLVEKLQGRQTQADHWRRSDIGLACSHMGKIAGCVGSAAAIRAAQGEKVLEIMHIRDGAATVVQQLWTVLEEARGSETGPSTSLLVSLVEIDDTDGTTLNDTITEADANPFDWAPFPLDNQSDQSDESALDPTFHELIFVLSGDRTKTIWLRAQLDTGMRYNAIKETVVKQAGLKPTPYKGKRLVGHDGAKVKPLGVVDIEFFFMRRQKNKTWNIPFLVLPEDAPYEVALGRRFLRQASLIKKNPEALYLSHEQMSKEQRKGVQDESQKRKEENQRVKEEQATQAKARRQQQKDSQSNNRKR